MGAMLDSYIIEEIRKRERLRQERHQPAVELPLPAPEQHPRRKSEEREEKPQRGVVIIDLAA